MSSLAEQEAALKQKDIRPGETVYTASFVMRCSFRLQGVQSDLSRLITT